MRGEALGARTLTSVPTFKPRASLGGARVGAAGPVQARIVPAPKAGCSACEHPFARQGASALVAPAARPGRLRNLRGPSLATCLRYAVSDPEAEPRARGQRLAPADEDRRT